METEVTSSVSRLFEKNHIEPKLYEAWKAEVTDNVNSLCEKFDRIKPELYPVCKAKVISNLRNLFEKRWDRENFHEDRLVPIFCAVATSLGSLFIGSTVAMMIVASKTEKFAKKVTLFTIGGAFISPSLVSIVITICVEENKIRRNAGFSCTSS